MIIKNENKKFCNSFENLKKIVSPIAPEVLEFLGIFKNSGIFPYVTSWPPSPQKCTPDFFSIYC